MLPDLVWNPGPLTYESGALPIALRGPAFFWDCSGRKKKLCLGTPQTIAIIVLKIEKFYITLH